MLASDEANSKTEIIVRNSDKSVSKWLKFEYQYGSAMVEEAINLGLAHNLFPYASGSNRYD